MSDTHIPQLILYACPVGPLAEHIEAYLDESKRLCGANAAHAYMPHCTLTGFFVDSGCAEGDASGAEIANSSQAITYYIDALEKVLKDYKQSLKNDLSPAGLAPKIQIEQLMFRPDWHGLSLKADWLKQLVATFSAQTHSPTLQAPLRLKDWLHLSLAYDFQPEHAPMLKQLADELIDISAEVTWELRFYQRSHNNTWRCHRAWPL